MIIVVTGGRDFLNADYIFKCLDYLHSVHPVSALKHGAARGVDSICGRWACQRGIPEIKCEADWDTHGKSAGILRNQSMLDSPPFATYAVIFPGGRGTADMRRRITKTGIPYWDCANATT